VQTIARRPNIFRSGLMTNVQMTRVQTIAKLSRAS
jgi:hypothetical protein